MIHRAYRIAKQPKLILDKAKGWWLTSREHMFAFMDARHFSKSNHKALFLDLGANLGQGHNWFKRYFDTDLFDFELFEPNPHCFAELKKLPQVQSGKVKIHNLGVGLEPGTFMLYGVGENEGGKFSQGGSILVDHNSSIYAAIEKNSIEVKIIKLSDYLRKKSETYDRIIVKMDIEGAEVDLLDGMIEDHSIELIDCLYVEFHSKYRNEKSMKRVKKQESKIINSLKKTENFRFRIWH